MVTWDACVLHESLICTHEHVHTSLECIWNCTHVFVLHRYDQHTNTVHTLYDVYTRHARILCVMQQVKHICTHMTHASVRCSARADANASHVTNKPMLAICAASYHMNGVCVCLVIQITRHRSPGCASYTTGWNQNTWMLHACVCSRSRSSIDPYCGHMLWQTVFASSSHACEHVLMPMQNIWQRRIFNSWYNFA